MAALKDYWSLTKAGLVLGNLITTFAGFALGSEGSPFNFALFIATVAGTCLVMASGCVFNNYKDRDIDARMERTKDRALVHRRVSARGALAFGAALGVLGFAILAFFTNILALAAAAVGFFFYVFMYTMWWKRRSVYGTAVGAVSGATPPVIGYCAASGRFDAAALILFIILVVWQMPHFFAIAIRREHDYAAAHIPVMPIARGIGRTKLSMLIYIVEFIGAAALLTIFGFTGYAYLAVVLTLGAAWLVLGFRGLGVQGEGPTRAWARQMFFASLIVMITLFLVIGIGAVV